MTVEILRMPVGYLGPFPSADWQLKQRLQCRQGDVMREILDG